MQGFEDAFATKWYIGAMCSILRHLGSSRSRAFRNDRLIDFATWRKFRSTDRDRGDKL